VLSKNSEEKIPDAPLRDVTDKHVTKGIANKRFHSGR